MLYLLVYKKSLVLSFQIKFLPRSTSDDIINSENHFSGLTGGDQGLFLNSQAFSDTEFIHASNITLVDVNTGSLATIDDFNLQGLNDFSRVITFLTLEHHK